MGYKQVILVIDELKLPKGKMAAQVAHASVEAVLKSDKADVTDWRLEGMPKVVLKVPTEKDLFKYMQQAKDAGLVVAIIIDAGKTTIAPNTTTCGAIGPDDEKKIDSLVSNLKLM
jgi:peptidyl-tRNA hydrolase, PTH2 family